MTKYYIIRSKLFSCILFALLLFANSPVQTNLGWEETFDDPTTQDWKLFGTNWTDELITIVDHDYAILNGQLYSQGETLQTSIFSSACRNGTTNINYVKANIFLGAEYASWGIHIGWNLNFNHDFYFQDIEANYTYFLFHRYRFYVESYHIVDGVLQQTDITTEDNRYPVIIDFDEWHVWEIYHEPTRYTVYLDGEILFQRSTTMTEYSNFDMVCLSGVYGSGNKFEDISVNIFPKSDKGSSKYTILLSIFGFTAITTLGYKGKAYHRKKKLITEFKIRNNAVTVIRDINQDFDVSNTSLLAFLGFRADDNYINELKDTIPQDILSFRYLMHPTRLMMVKLLAGEVNLSSSDLRHILGIPWGDYTTHLKSLESKGYVEITQQFNEQANLIQIVSLTQNGRQEYKRLFELLTEVVERRTPLDFVLNSNRYHIDELYPEYDRYRNDKKMEELNQYVKEAKNKLEHEEHI